MPNICRITTFLIIGAGGLGAPLAAALAPHGRVVLCDDDFVDVSNLQRQILYRTCDVGRPKVEAARDALLRRFPSAQIEAVRARFDESSARALVCDADVVCDGSDNLPTKFLVNDVCRALGRRFVIGGVLRHAGQMFAVRPGIDACYRCLFEAPPAEGEILSCADAGVLGAMCGVVAGWQARAARALATGDDPHDLLGKVWLFDEDRVRAIAHRQRAGCCARDSKEAAS